MSESTHEAAGRGHTDSDPNAVHEATETEASNGMGTVTHSLRGETLDHPILDGSTEYYGDEGGVQNPRFGEKNPGLIRHPETGEETPTPDEEG